MRIEDDVKLDYKDVLLRPKRSSLESRKQVSIDRQIRFSNGRYLNGVPIIAANMDGVGTFEVADTLIEQNMFTCLKKSYEVNELVEYFQTDDNPVSKANGRELAIGERNCGVAMSIGLSEKDLNKFRMVQELTNGAVRILNVDVANGYTERFADFIRQLRLNFANLIIIAGNVCTADQTQELILSGADIVKVGIGPGSVCTTRIKTACGYPQLSAVMECADAAHGLNGFIIADGGCTSPGDVVKAFGAGADFVMLGGMLAGHDQGGGEIIPKYYDTGEVKMIFDDGMSGEIPTRTSYEPVIEERWFVEFYGMSSKAANDKHFGGLKNYRASEGREVLIPYRGDINTTVEDILGGLRSAMTYIGAKKIKHIGKCSTFIRCNDTHNRVFES